MTRVCEWSQDEDGNWATDCGNAFVLNDGTPLANKMFFCCYCGLVLAQRLFVSKEPHDRC